VRYLHSFGVKGSLGKLEIQGSVSCGSSVTVLVITDMVVIAKLGYLNGWRTWKTKSKSPLML
jgi:hypothetical protein